MSAVYNVGDQAQMHMMPGFSRWYISCIRLQYNKVCDVIKPRVLLTAKTIYIQLLDIRYFFRDEIKKNDFTRG